ncbi:HupE/UreJ family protein [Rathayibacter sp. VKM Ac-2835]|nr:HupE/UreJ family protein [Rathayibacter sp. VKM Ac-2835]
MGTATTPPAWTNRRGSRLLLALLALVLALAAPLGVTGALSASAHPLSTSAVLLDIGAHTVQGEIQLPIDRLAIALDQPLTAESFSDQAVLGEVRQYVQDHVGATSASDTWTAVVDGGIVERLDEVDHLIFSLELTPTSGNVDDFVLRYDAIVEALLSHQIFVSARTGDSGSYSSVGLLDWNDPTIEVQASDYANDLAAGFLSSVRLGFTHITEGADHLLFLLMLLLPAPLLARRGRWVRSGSLRRDVTKIIHVVTAFAVGHSITLALGALGLLDLPTRVVESLIALSVVVSGIHAVRPLVKGGEAWIAGGFGLMHGLAFAALIDELDLGRDSLVADLVGFNLGIELTQLVVVALVMPSLLVLARTKSYTVIRLTLAVGGTVLALGWLAERTGLLAVDPMEPVATALIDNPLALPSVLAAAALFSWWGARRRSRRTVDATS